MRTISSAQLQLNFFPEPTKETKKFHQKYEAISELLDKNPNILRCISSDLAQPLKYSKPKSKNERQATYSADQFLRILLVMCIESLSLRDLVVRIDDSNYFRHFTRLFDKKMMDFTTVNKLRNSIQSIRWEKINLVLTKYAIKEDLISGQRLRLDTTAVETNIHYPTDSSLLWDCYRVLSRLIKKARKINPMLVGSKRTHKKKAKRLFTMIARVSGKKKKTELFLSHYRELIRYVETLLKLVSEVSERITTSLNMKSTKHEIKAQLCELQKSMNHFSNLSEKVIYQASQRVLFDDPVSAEEKIFSIFEEHTELLRRGKAGKSIEYGHMIELEQVEQKFITNYRVFDKRPNEPDLAMESIKHHRKIFGSYPEVITADKGYYKSTVVEEIGKKVNLVAIAKKGKRTNEETELEHRVEFRKAQKFRAGIEGSISFLKRKLGLWRCVNKGWENYCSTVGMTILAHNLLKLVAL